MDVSGIVLAGGMSRRLGRNKALEPINGEPLISRVFKRLSSVSEQAVVVVNNMERASVLPLPASAKVAVDLYPDGGSLGGIFTGLSAADGEWGLVVACDMPFLNVALFEHMLSLRRGFDAVVPVLDGRPEPTHAVYSKTCLKPMERKLKANDLKITGFFDEVRVRLVSQEDIEKLDPERLSFFNVNTQEDLDRALALAAQGR
ncbi:MAG: molybdenum cofactor guanylyltransferase [Chloroflexi bacterium]|nr:molybdenum cofactor guanylyltransferase [Chloroflexota bacterium]